MKKLAPLFLVFGILLSAISPAQARVFVTAGYYGYPGYAYPAYAYPYPAYPYYAPPPVVYATPGPAPVFYPSPAPVAYAAPPAQAPVIPATPSLAADQTSPTFTDSQGRTCRQFQTTAGVGPASGTACLMPNGTWQTVQ